MQKTMITATTVFALFMSAGASMAGPLNGHGFSGKAHDVRSTVSQALNNADQMAHTYHADKGFGQDQDNLSVGKLGESPHLSTGQKTWTSWTCGYSGGPRPLVKPWDVCI
ncbi:hypothetical protein [Phaeobacter gallaeciensis]|uniref:Outer membrane autotransporter n=1 Tax=Phaeobacter gallaeciensis TaxID=60890 RepID=A0AAC9Z9M9_9RHOB|nr:hypothetical protein [Phaeobacter gallaeciensis]AHD10062.1 hypothetical protein Gal_02316 [Phaeobacter gallaeciensis DSM 26640]ATE93326.1 outer membrane autotransporter [Phaeobacter gallaeciensis]ATE96853.1 outer membrane autotransporter [Phaeobacter gallaeciensis]ATF01990.1 outer membrane autotransporter [Phaeobacter gallaeciensis]ATF06370.1 outer membrane autotransporter [Phaeobacter gallaeciensis]